VSERGGYDLLPELGYRPVNKYLPLRQRDGAPPAAPPAGDLQPLGDGDGSLLDSFFAWVDRALGA
jgi:sulfite dehydrogenase (quinone) subunit SoeB